MIVSGLMACGGANVSISPNEVMNAYTAAINAGDVEKALSYVDDNAVYSRPVGKFTGKAEVRTFVQDLVTRKAKIELLGQRTVQGENVTWVSRVTLIDPQNPGAPPTTVTNNSASVVRNNKIVQHTATRAP